MTSARQCQLLWVDPGVTTGLFVVTVRPGWVSGDQGDGSWESLRKATVKSWHSQVGRWSRVVDGNGTSRPHNDPSFVVRAKRGGRGAAGSAVLKQADADELTQAVQIADVLDAWPDAAWGVEDFRLRPLPGNTPFTSDPELLAPVRMIARLETLEILHGERGRVPFRQQPSERTIANDDRLQRAGWYRSGMDHANDAARHAAVFLRKCRENKDLRHEAFPRVFTNYVPQEKVS